MLGNILNYIQKIKLFIKKSPLHGVFLFSHRGHRSHREEFKIINSKDMYDVAICTLGTIWPTVRSVQGNAD